MDIQALKDYIIENSLIQQILEACECHHIVDRGKYISCANPDGDNLAAVQVFKDTLCVINYTRNITNGKKSADIFDLVSFYKQSNFFEAVKFICAAVGIDIYHDFEEDVPESIKVTRLLLEMIQGDELSEEQKQLKPISEKILSVYDSCAVQPFIDDNITADVQYEMQIGYDQLTNRISIPIKDAYGTLVGIKGRYFGKPPEGVPKYNYLEPCAKGQVLYGLFRALPYITRQGRCYVVESEKGVMQAMSYGVDNVVACGGKNMSSCQIEMLSRLCVDIILCFDKDVELDELRHRAEQFIGSVNVYAVYDKANILSDKESPTDDPDKFERLITECVIKLRRGDAN